MPVYGEMNISIQRSVPTVGQTVSLTRESIVYALIEPAGTLATLTINMPSSPQDGDEVLIASSQILTALTMANGTLVGTLTTLALGGFARFVYNTASTKWFRVG